MRIEKDGWRLVSEKTGLIVDRGDIMLSSDLEKFVVVGGSPPHKPASSGRVFGYWKNDEDPDPNYRLAEHEYFPHVFKLKWEKSNDRKNTE